MLRTSSAASGLLALLLLGGCASDGGQRTHAIMRDPASLAAHTALDGRAVSPAAWPSATWYARYGDAQLDALIAEALAANPGLRIAEARVRQAAALGEVAGASLAPQIAASERTARQLFSGNSTVPKPLAGNWAWSNDASVNLSYEFDFWGKNQASLEAAIGRRHAAEVESQAARLMLAVAISQAYLRLSQSWAQRDLAAAVLQQREHLLRLTAERVRAHLDSAVDQKQAELAVPLAREQVAAIDEAIALGRYQLAALLGAGPDRGAAIARPALRTVTVSAAALPTNLPSELLARRPDVVAQRWRVEAAARDIEVAKAQFYPSFNLGALIGLQSLGFDRFLAAGSRVSGASGALNLPIFDGGRLRGALGARQAEYDAAVEQYNLTLVDALRDVVSQLASITALRQRADLQAEALAAARQAHALSLQRYQAGVGNYLQVLSTDLQVLSLERAGIDFAARAFDLDIALVRALGGGYTDGATDSLQLSSAR